MSRKINIKFIWKFLLILLTIIILLYLWFCERSLVIVVWDNILSLWCWLWYNDGRIKKASEITTIVSPIIALLGLGFIWWQLYSNAVQAKRVRTYEFFEKYYDPKFVTFSKEARARLRNPSVLTKEEIDDDRELMAQIISFLNYFEDACHMYNEDLVDRGIFRQSMRDAVIVTYTKCKNHIQALIDANVITEDSYEQLKKTYGEFNKK